MRRRLVPLIALVTLAALSAAFPAVGRGQETVASGFDLYQTLPGTQLSFPCPGGETQRIAFQGLPLETFDFGAAGVHDVGLTDNIVRRLEDAVADAGAAATVDVEMVALSLVSREPVAFCGGPAEEIFVTLDEEMTAALTDTGRWTLHFDPKFFETAAAEPGMPNPRLHFWVDVSGSASGPIGSFEKRFFISNEPQWSRLGPPGALKIEGVNYLLDGATDGADFFPLGPVVEDDGSSNWRKVKITTVPVSSPAVSAWSTLLLAVLMLAAMAWAMRRRPAGGER